jgi:hypothetical protein
MAMPTVAHHARIDLKYYDGTSNWGSRFFIFYGAGVTPDEAALNTLAAGIQSMWTSDMAQAISEAYSLVAVTATDLTSTSGPVGEWTGSEAGTVSGAALPSNVSADADLFIADRYRGGHPVMHFPPPPAGYLGTERTYSTSYKTNFDGWVTEFLNNVNSYEISGGVDIVWNVLRGYRNGASPSDVAPWPVLNASLRKTVGTMRKRARALR